MPVTKTFSIELDLPDVEIDSVQIDRDGTYLIRAHSTLIGCRCHQCGQPITKFHGYDREIRIKHLPILGRETYLLIRLPRYQCLHCPKQPTTTQQVPWRERKSAHTKANEKHILLELIGSTVEAVSLKEGIGYETVMGIVRRYMSQEVDWAQFDRLDQMGLDEISLKKGHQDFVTIVSARIEGEIHLLAVLADRKKETVKAFLQRIPRTLRQTVGSICSDLYEGFINPAKEVFGQRVRIVLDRFHVAKLYRKGLDGLRKQELKRLKSELSEPAYGELKGVMWVLRKKKKALTQENKSLLKKLFEYSPKLKTAYELQNNLTEIFEMNCSRSGGKRRLRNWMRRVEAVQAKCYALFVQTLTKWLEEISNYFVKRETSGFVEGLNNKIKVIKRRCYGILNKENLFQRISLDLSGYKTLAV
jgi:transposase